MSSSDHCRLFCCAIWRIWTHKNLVLHEGSQIKGKEIADWITRYIGEIDNLEDKKFTRYVNEEWCPPLGSDVKVNFDVAYNQSLARSGSGVVVCKSRGEILVSKHTLQKEIVSPFAAEGYACLQGRLFWDIQRLKRSFHSIKFKHIPRSANTLAHSLATDCLKNGRESYLIGSVPIVVDDRLWGRRRRESDSQKRK
ncbi:hypothetical protein Goarm_022546, partial [Gossypium armourianum]|nr:hypothetical protein [Gossypium armourianum]